MATFAPLKIDAVIFDVDALLDDQGEPRPGAVDLVQGLVDRKIPLAAVTSGTQATFDARLGRHPDLRYSMSAVVTADDEAENLYVKAAQRLGVDAPACLACDATQPGLEAAQSAGCLLCALSSGLEGLRPNLTLPGGLATLDHERVLEFERKPPLAFMVETCTRWKECNPKALGDYDLMTLGGRLRRPNVGPEPGPAGGGREELLAKLRGNGEKLRGDVSKLAAEEEAATTTLPKL